MSKAWLAGQGFRLDCQRAKRGRVDVSRQRYETQGDRENQRAAIEKITTALSFGGNAGPVIYQFVELPDVHRLDYALLRFDYRNNGKKGVALGFAEYKRRHNDCNAYPDLMISATKFDRGKELYEAGHAFLIFIEWDDGLFWYKYDPEHEVFYRDESGRTRQTRDDWDIERCAHIPIRYFKRLF
jgi:hypothetical protein